MWRYVDRVRISSGFGFVDMVWGAFFVHGLVFLRCRCRCGFFVVGGVVVERARRREFAEFVADHVLGDEHWDMLVAVVHAEREAHELRQDGGTARPGLDHFIAATTTYGLHLLQEVTVDKGAFPG